MINKRIIIPRILKAAIFPVLLAPAATVSVVGADITAQPEERIKTARAHWLAQQSDKSSSPAGKRHAATTGTDTDRMPVPANPYLSYLPQTVEPDYAYWRRQMRQKLRQRSDKHRLQGSPAAFNRLIEVDDVEPNDSFDAPQTIAGVESLDETANAVDISGSVGPQPPKAGVESAEDDGAIGQANPTDLAAGVVGTAEAYLGDGPHGSAGTGSGDFDFYRVSGLAADSELHLDIDAQESGSSLDSMLAVYDDTGTLLHQNDDAGGLDSALKFVIPAAGDYYVAVSAFGAGFPADPFDSSTGSGATSEGEYTLNIAFIQTQSLGSFAEDDGAIGQANPTDVAPGDAVWAEGEIGDGPHGSTGTGSGDVDMFAVQGVQAGESVLVSVPVNADVLDWIAHVYDADGNRVLYHDGIVEKQFSFEAPADGDYYVAVSGYPNVLADPFDSASGDGAAAEGPYSIRIERIEDSDEDFYAVELAAGDVVGADVSSRDYRLSLFGPDERLLIGSSQNATGIFPETSPLTELTDPVALAYIAPTDGVYTVKIGYSDFADRIFGGNYESRLRLYKPGLHASPAEQRQVLFLDFDGASIDAGALFGRGNNPARLSPLNAFLADWGLTADDEDAVIDAIVASVEESLEADLQRDGNNSRFSIELRNSRDHDDPFGADNVSRVIVGGTIDELGLSTIGIAQSIDPGNYAADETAVVLLDLLSAAPDNSISLNWYSLDAGAAMVDLVGVAVGNIVAHEAGHFFANFHTDAFNEHANIMDQGGNLAGMIGIGDDGVFGTGDDEDVDFIDDIYTPNEGFEGNEDTLNLTAFGLTSGNPPVISPVAHQTVSSRPPVHWIGFEVTDADHAFEELTLSAEAADQNLVPSDGLSFEGTGPEATLVVTPVQGVSGTTEITLSASDGISQSNAVFDFTVNSPPEIESIDDQTVGRNGSIRGLPVVAVDNDGLPSALTLTASADDAGLVPAGGLSVNETDAGYTLDIVPARAATGTTAINVTASDGLESAHTRFDVTVKPSSGRTIRSRGSGGGTVALPFLMLLLGSAVVSRRRCRR